MLKTRQHGNVISQVQTARTDYSIFSTKREKRGKKEGSRGCLFGFCFKSSRVGAAPRRNGLACEDHMTLTPGFLSGLLPPALHFTVLQTH